MKAKLVKRSNGRFDLYEIKDVDQLNTIASSFDNPKGKLSLKNCQAIELGYNINKLAENHWDENNKHYKGEINPYAHKFGYIAGFQKALELLGDKKFSSKEMIFAYTQGTNDGSNVQSMVENEDEDAMDYAETCTNEFIQSLQQTKWDVEIVMECCGKVYSQHCDRICEHVKPLLDAEGCLILKRI